MGKEKRIYSPHIRAMKDTLLAHDINPASVENLVLYINKLRKNIIKEQKARSAHKITAQQATKESKQLNIEIKSVKQCKNGLASKISVLEKVVDKKNKRIDKLNSNNTKLTIAFVLYIAATIILSINF